MFKQKLKYLYILTEAPIDCRQIPAKSFPPPGGGGAAELAGTKVRGRQHRGDGGCHGEEVGKPRMQEAAQRTVVRTQV